MLQLINIYTYAYIYIRRYLDPKVSSNFTDDDDVFLDRITQENPKTIFRMQNTDRPEKA
jgi:hypothetical protein